MSIFGPYADQRRNRPRAARARSRRTRHDLGRLRCSVSMISMRAMSRRFWFSSPLISAICLSSSAIWASITALRSVWFAIAALISQRPSSVTSAALPSAAAIPRKNSCRWRLRCASRHGSRLILGCQVEVLSADRRRKQAVASSSRPARRAARGDLISRADRRAGGDADPARDTSTATQECWRSRRDQDLPLLAALPEAR